jgi:hypothetical protein
MQNCAQCGTPLSYGTTTCPGCGHFVAYNSPSWGGYNTGNGGPATNQDAFQPPHSSSSPTYNPAPQQGQPPYSPPSQQGEFSPSFPPYGPASQQGLLPYTGPIQSAYNPPSQPLNPSSLQGQAPYNGPVPQTYGPPSQPLNPSSLQGQAPYNGPVPQTYGPPSLQGQPSYGEPVSQAFGPPSQVLNPPKSPATLRSYMDLNTQVGIQQQSPQPPQPLQESSFTNTPSPYYGPPPMQALPFAAQGQPGSMDSQGDAKQGLSKKTLISAVVIAFLLIGSGISLIFYTAVARPAQMRAQASATVQAIANTNAHASATANTYVTATARASATAQAQAQATANAIEVTYTQSTNRTPAFDSTMAFQDQANWDIYNAVGGGGCAFTGGALHSSIAQKQFYVPCFAQATNFNNFVFQVEMTIIKGDEGGLIFRANDMNSKYYYFRIGRDGIYSLNVSKDDKHSTPIAFDSSPTIKTGAGQMNLITVIAKGSTIYLYINKHFVNSTTDKSYSMGKIGVFAGDNRNATDVAFNNARVWQL